MTETLEEWKKSAHEERDRADRTKVAFATLQDAVEKFLYKANLTPPWESAGAVWGDLLLKLNNALVESKEKTKEKPLTVYELRGIGDAVNYKEDETDKMCDALKAHLAEYTEAPGHTIEIVTKMIRPQDFKRLAD